MASMGEPEFFRCGYIVGSRGASQLGNPPGYKANKLLVSLSYPLGIITEFIRNYMQTANIFRGSPMLG